MPEKTALMYAVRGNCDTQEVKQLIDEGADVNAVDEYGQTALWHALDACPANISAFQALIAAGANVNAANNNGATVLMAAVSLVGRSVSESNELVNILIDAGANVNAVDKRGETALMNAVSSWGNIAALPLLIEAGADTNATDDIEWSALSHLEINDLDYFANDENLARETIEALNLSDARFYSTESVIRAIRREAIQLLGGNPEEEEEEDY